MQELAGHTCAACAGDGGYGTAVVGSYYHCPACRVIWSPTPHGTSTTTAFGNWWQRTKVRLISRPMGKIDTKLERWCTCPQCGHSAESGAQGCPCRHARCVCRH